MGQLQTRNVTIFFSDVADGNFRAQALAQTCESDISRLASLFRIPFDVDTLNASGVHVHIISPPSGGATNTGWGGGLSPSNMDINGDFSPSAPNIQTANVRADLTRFLFVAELAEIFMDIAPGVWNRGWSDGEALSTLLATELHPTAYYGAVGGVPRVNPWLQSERRDWISVTESTDTNILSYGCGILFLNYLRHQLGFDLAQIIATRPKIGLGTLGRYTLADRYATLTGKPPEQAYPEFMAFLEQRLPIDQAPLCWVGRDDIFPLQDAGRRTVFVSTDTQQLSAVREEPSALVALKPGLLCGEGEYRFWRVDETNQIVASASCAGFAMASFHWSINGVPVGPGNQSFSLGIKTDISVPHSDRTTETQLSDSVEVSYVVDTTWNRSRLNIQNVEHEGTYKLNVQVTATERLMHDGDSATTRETELPTVHFEYDPRFAADQRRCNGDIEGISAALQKMSEQMILYKNAPDPQPDQRMGAILAAAELVNSRIAAAAEKMGKTGPVFMREFSRNDRIAQEVTAANARVLDAQRGRVDLQHVVPEVSEG